METLDQKEESDKDFAWTLDGDEKEGVDNEGFQDDGSLGSDVEKGSNSSLRKRRSDRDADYASSKGSDVMEKSKHVKSFYDEDVQV